MAELLKHYLFYTFHSMTKYDYMAIGWVLFLALLFIVLAAFVSHKKGVSLFLLFLGMLLLFLGPPAIKIALDRYIRTTQVTLTKIKPLKYSGSLLVEGSVANEGRIDFSHCDLVLSIYRPDRFLGDMTAWLKPRRVAIEPLNSPLPRGDSKPFRLIVDHFTSPMNDLNATLYARCYP